MNRRLANKRQKATTLNESNQLKLQCLKPGPRYIVLTRLICSILDAGGP